MFCTYSANGLRLCVVEVVLSDMVSVIMLAISTTELAEENTHMVQQYLEHECRADSLICPLFVQ